MVFGKGKTERVFGLTKPSGHTTLSNEIKQFAMGKEKRKCLIKLIRKKIREE